MKNNYVMIAIILGLGYLLWMRMDTSGVVIVPTATPTVTPTLLNIPASPVVDVVEPTNTPFYVAPTAEIVPVHIRSTSEPVATGEKGSHETGRTDHRSP